MSLRTDYKDAIPASGAGTLRKYQQIDNGDGTFSFQDVTEYSQAGDKAQASVFNEIGEEVNAHKADTNNPHQTTPEQIGAVQGNTKAWVATKVEMADETGLGILLTIPDFVYSKGCQVTFLSPVSPIENVWMTIGIKYSSDDIALFALRTLTHELVTADAWAPNSQITVTLDQDIKIPLSVEGSDRNGTAFFKGGAPSVPSIFGTGADGDAVISGTVTLPVEVPHQSIVEKNYKSLIINAGAILKCASWNAGLILRVKGDCTIHGTIDQSGLAPKTNPQNNYPYPAQLVCGDGGNGATAAYAYGGYGGTAMLKRAYGGGYGAGGAGGNAASTNNGDGGNGGDSTSCTIDVANIFRGGASGDPIGYNGAYGGGGGAGNGALDGGDGGTGGGGNGDNGVKNSSSNSSPGGGGGGAGNYGGGVILLFVAGNLLIDGALECNGLNGGNGGTAGTSAYGIGHDGSGGGGGGGGAIYILHRGTYTNTGALQVNGGQAGTGQTTGTAGGVGSITVIQGDK